MFIAFRLKPGRDDDLIAWVNTLGVDERSAGIRQALRGNLTRVEVETFPHREHRQSIAEVKKIEPRQVDPVTPDIESNLDSWL